MPTHGFELSLPFFALALGVLANLPYWWSKLKHFLFPVLFFLTFAATASKGPTGLLLTLSACASLLVILFFKDYRVKTPGCSRAFIFSFLATLSGFLIAYTILLRPSGGTGGLSLSPGWLAWKTFGSGHNYSGLYALLIPFHIIGFLPFGAFGSAKWILNTGKNIFKPAGIVILTSALAGIFGAYFFEHVGMSNVYFMLFAVPCLNLLASEWTFSRWSEMKKISRILTISVVMLAFTSFFSSVYFYRSFQTVYRVYRGVPIVRSVVYYLLSKEEFAALNWISGHTPQESVLASEKFWISDDKDNEAGSARFFYYSAFSKRQMYLEGWAYSSWAYPDRPNSSKERDELRRRLNLLNDIFSNGEKAGQIMRQEGIDYILVDRKQRPDFESSTLKLLYKNERVAVFSLP